MSTRLNLAASSFGRDVVDGMGKDEFALRVAMRTQRVLGDPGDEASLIKFHEGLQILDGATRNQIRMKATKLSIAGVGFRNLDITADITVTGLNGIDVGAEAANTWYALHAITPRLPKRSVDVRLLLSLSGTAPAIPRPYYRSRRVAWVRNNGALNLYRIKNAPDSNEFWYNEDISAADFEVYNGTVPAANVWQDADSSIPAPPGASHVWVDLKGERLSTALMILRAKDKDLTNIGAVNDTLTSFTKVLGSPVRVGLDASRVWQLQCNSITTTVKAYVKSYEDIR